MYFLLLVLLDLLTPKLKVFAACYLFVSYVNAEAKVSVASFFVFVILTPKVGPKRYYRAPNAQEVGARERGGVV